MDAALTKVRLERERILARIAGQRAAVVTSFAGLATPISLLDRVIGVGQFWRSHPAALAVVVALRARSVLRLLARGIGLWRIAREVRLMARRLGL